MAANRDKAASDKTILTKCRIDKWLWAARFFKTRKLATEAVQGGHVHLNGVRAKAARAIVLDDELSITKGMYQFIIHVKVLADKRGSATIAQALYVETEASKKHREELSIQRKNQTMAAPLKRPDKRERGKIIRFKNKFAP